LVVVDRIGERGVLDVERSAELHGSIRSPGADQRAGAPVWDRRNTVRRALRSDEPPAYRRPVRPSKLEPFKEEIHRLLRDDLRLPGVRARELIDPLGFGGSKTIVV
jgi:hypothetical protein